MCAVPGGNGQSCTDPSQCNSGFCTDGACCSSANCPQGQRCDVPGRRGDCSSVGGTLGRPCTDPAQCDSGFCTDGVCCEGDVCPDGRTCAVPGLEGMCAVPGGDGQTCTDPSQCNSGFCTDGVCCDNDFCPQGQRCDVPGLEGTCAVPGGNGQTCMDPSQCNSGFCTDGVCCDNDFCPPGQRCDIPGAAGTCTEPNVSGGPCSIDAQCQPGLVCRFSPLLGQSLCTPAAGQCTCIGDCDCNGQVTVDEIITMVNIALGDASLLACLMGDANLDGQITVDEILTAVLNALNGCPLTPPSPTPAVTATPTATTTPGAVTPGAGSLPQQASGSALVMATSLQAIPAVLSSLTQLAAGNGAGAAFDVDVGSAAGLETCSGGGNRNFLCTQTAPGIPPRNYDLTFNSCVLDGPGGGRISVDGDITAQSDESGLLASCSVPPLALSAFTLDGVRAVIDDAQGTTTLDATFDLTGSATVTPDLFSPCRVAALTLQLSGSARVETGGRDQTLNFSSTQLRLDIEQFSADCVPLAYTMTLNGDAGVTDEDSGQTFSGDFVDFVIGIDAVGANTSMTIAGMLDSDCLGVVVSFTTPTAMVFAPGTPCPTSGVVLTTASGTTDRVTYTPSGIEIDLGDDGGPPDETYAGCAAANLCPGP
jgi:hypothetical protein